MNEADGGLQVIDMTRIDENIVTLVRTDTSAFRTAHTIAVDEIGGFLYAADARPGSMAMRVFSLADPASPQ